jgi:hypothetical protein
MAKALSVHRPCIIQHLPYKAPTQRSMAQCFVLLLRMRVIGHGTLGCYDPFVAMQCLLSVIHSTDPQKSLLQQ